ncbi:MAG: SHOCT domain-containing protein [Myxococcota bacterium]
MHGFEDAGPGTSVIVWWGLASVAIVVVAWAIVRAAARRRRGRYHPEDDVDRRYARGEIDRDTHRKSLRNLRV